MDKQLKAYNEEHDELRQYAFYFDQTRCGACNACTVQCKEWNEVKPGPVKWRTQFTHERAMDASAGIRFFPFSYGCNHCEEPACVDVCSFDAISKDPESGAVIIDRNKCQNAQACISACPFAKPQIADDKQEPEQKSTWLVTHPAQKCTMCLGSRVNNAYSAGLKPACVMSCVGRALDFGTVEYITETYEKSDVGAVRLNPMDFPYAYINENQDGTVTDPDGRKFLDTKPRLWVKKMPFDGGLKIHKSTIYTGKY